MGVQTHIAKITTIIKTNRCMKDILRCFLGALCAFAFDKASV